ncbi:hypothetical protein OB920_06095 [Halobacteria archaeon HArc-gm2]|nr:hypothetical protein [Halobacteria archaeon HArc-gm2]
MAGLRALTVRTLAMRTLTAAGATVGLLQTYGLPFAWNVGPAGRRWEPVRRTASRALGTALDYRAGPRPITEGEYAGTYPGDRGEFEELLWREEFVRNPFSRLKVREDGPEVGSWVTRDSPLADRQLHLMLFPGEDGVDVYAHEEISSVNPLLGPAHFDGADQRVALGVEMARERFPIEPRRPWIEPPEGAWDESPDVA